MDNDLGTYSISGCSCGPS